VRKIPMHHLLRQGPLDPMCQWDQRWILLLLDLYTLLHPDVIRVFKKVSLIQKFIETTLYDMPC
jgi:hypothetical protein